MTTYIGHRLPWSYHALIETLRQAQKLMVEAFYVEHNLFTEAERKSVDLDKVDFAAEVPVEYQEVQTVLAAVQNFNFERSMGVVQDATFINCFWPKLDQPTRLFADGSSGIKVMGSARNVWFPDDTIWLTYYPDALYPAEMAVRQAFPSIRGLVNLSEEQAQIWQAAYDAAVAEFPVTHSIFESPRDVLFIRHSDLITTDEQKPNYEEYVSVVDTATAAEIVAGNISVSDSKLALDFWKLKDPGPDADPNAKLYTITVENGKEVVSEKGEITVTVPIVPTDSVLLTSFALEGERP